MSQFDLRTRCGRSRGEVESLCDTFLDGHRDRSLPLLRKMRLIVHPDFPSVNWSRATADFMLSWEFIESRLIPVPKSLREIGNLLECGLSWIVRHRYPSENAFRTAAIRLQTAAQVATAGAHEVIRSGAKMAKTNRKLKKANHGRRPASAKARRLKRQHVRLSR